MEDKKIKYCKIYDKKNKFITQGVLMFKNRWYITIHNGKFPESYNLHEINLKIYCDKKQEKEKKGIKI